MLHRAGGHEHRWLQVFLEKACKLSAGQKNLSLDSDLQVAWQQIAELLGVDDMVLSGQLASYYGFEACTEKELESVPMDCIAPQVIQEFNVVPLEDNGRVLRLAVSNPFDADMLSMLSFTSSRALVLKLAPPRLLRSWVKTNLQEALSEKIIDEEKKRSVELDQSVSVQSDSAIATLVNRMFMDAAHRNASDIHIEPFCGCGEVRYRVDGLLLRVTTLPKLLFEHVVRRVKAIAQMNVVNSLVPQDGRASITVDEQHYDLRVSSVPVSGGEKVVIRLLRQSGVVSLADIGIQPGELQKMRDLLSSSSGIFVMTGPTGSGKSTTLYSALSEVNTFERCLVTVEDPVEYQVEGVAQISVNRAQDVTFASALRSILRQDPDIILVGEIRDEETAQITLRAAITGHFVMSTLHTRDAVTTVPRLLDLGLTESSIADALCGLAAQRLLRKLCAHCSSISTGDDPLEQLYAERFPGAPLHKGSGCDQCNGTGYRGRFPILELVKVDREFADGIRNRLSTSVLRDIARKNGSRSLSELAREAIADGRTSVMEAYRIMGAELWE